MPKFKKAKNKTKKRKLILRKAELYAKIKKPLVIAKRARQKDESVEIFDSTVGSTKSLFIVTPKKPSPLRKARLYADKNLFNSLLAGLIVAGLFSATLYVFAVPPTSKYTFSETLNPSCTPGSTNCAVEAPAVVYSFGSNNFSGTGTFTTTGALSAGAITGTSFIIGANTLTTTEWTFLDGQDQAVKTVSSPTFANITDSGLTITRIPYVSTAGLLVDSANLTFDGTTLTAGGFTTTGTLGAGATTLTSLVVDTTTLAINAVGYEDKVGIGTATPQATLDVNGTIRGGGGASEVILEARDGASIFRGLSNTWINTWSDDVGTTYFQTGVIDGNTAFSALNGTPYTRFAFVTNKFQVTNTISDITPPTYYFQIDWNNVNLFSVSTAGNVNIAGTLGAGAITGTSFTDSTATLTGGALSGVTTLSTTGNSQLGDATSDIHGMNTAAVANQMLTSSFATTAIAGTIIGHSLTLASSGAVGVASSLVLRGDFLDINLSGSQTNIAGDLYAYGNHVDIDDTTTYNSATTNDAYIYGAYNDVDFAGTATSWTTYNQYGTYNTVTGNIAALGDARKYGTYNVLTGTADNSYAGYFSATGGTINYGVYVAGITTALTTNAGIWIENIAGATNDYGIVLDSDDAGGGAIWFGLAQDAYMGFDSNSLNIVANAVTTTDDMEFTAESYTFKTNADTDLAVNFSGTTSSGLFTWMEDEDYFAFADDIFMNASENITIGAATGVKLSAATGVLTLAGIGNTNNENLTLDFEATANTVKIGTGTGVTTLDLNALALTTTGTLGAGATTVTSLTDSGLTSGRIPYASTGGLLVDSANFLFDGQDQTFLTGRGFILSDTSNTRTIKINYNYDSTGSSANYINFMVGETTQGVGFAMVPGATHGGRGSTFFMYNSLLPTETANYERLSIQAKSSISPTGAVLSWAKGGTGVMRDISVLLGVTNTFNVIGGASQSANLQEWQDSSFNILSSVSSGGSFGIRMTGAPTAYLHLGAGTATAGTAPLKFTAGTVTTAAVAGQIEYTTGLFQIRADNFGLIADNGKMIFGAESDASIYFDGSALIIDPNLVTAGDTVKIGATANDTIDAGAYKVAGAAGVSNTYDDGVDTQITFIGGIATAISTAFDESLLENISPIGEVLPLIGSIRVSTYNWGETGLAQFPEEQRDKKRTDQLLGFVAQDFQNTFPEILEQKGDYITYNRNYLEVIMMKAIQELNQKVNALGGGSIKISEPVALNESGSAGEGGLPGVSNSSMSVKGVLISLGMKVADGVATLKEVITTRLSTQTARIEKMEMVDSATGEVWCTWIENGEWQKAKGECVTATIATAVEESPAPAQKETPASEKKVAQEAGEQQPEQPSVSTEEIVQQVTEQVTEQIAEQQQATKEAVQESKAAAQSAKQAAKSAEQSAKKAEQQIEQQVQQEVTQQLEAQQQEQTPEEIPALVEEAPVPVAEETPVETPATVEEAPSVQPSPEASAGTVGDIIQESAAGLLNSMWEFLKGIINFGAEKISSLPIMQKATAGLMQIFNEAKKEIEISLQDTTPMLIKNSSAGLSNSFQNISGPLQDLWIKIEKLIHR